MVLLLSVAGSQALLASAFDGAILVRLVTARAVAVGGDDMQAGELCPGVTRCTGVALGLPLVLVRRMAALTRFESGAAVQLGLLALVTRGAGKAHHRLAAVRLVTLAAAAMAQRRRLHLACVTRLAGLGGDGRRMGGLLVAIDTLPVAFAFLALGCLCRVAAAAQPDTHGGLGKIVSGMTGTAFESICVKRRPVRFRVACGAGACTALGCERWLVDRVATQARARLCIGGMLARLAPVTRQTLRPRRLLANVVFAMTRAALLMARALWCAARHDLHVLMTRLAGEHSLPIEAMSAVARRAAGMRRRQCARGHPAPFSGVTVLAAFGGRDPRIVYLVAVEARHGGVGIALSMGHIDLVVTTRAVFGLQSRRAVNVVTIGARRLRVQLDGHALPLRLFVTANAAVAFNGPVVAKAVAT